MRGKLTKRVVDAAKPGDKDVIVWDTDLKGFGLKVSPSGRKTFILFYRTQSGQQRKPTVGTYGELTAEEARAVAKGWLADATKGGDISGTRQRARQAETVKELAERYLTDHAEAHKKPSSIAADRAIIDNHVLPLIGHMKVADVTREDIERAILAIRDGKTARTLPARRGRRIVKGGRIIANRVLALIGKLFACAEQWGLREGNPARRLRKFKEMPRDRFLSEDEIRRLHEALDTAERERTVNPYAIAALRLLLYTGLRRGEVIGLRWREVDLAAGCLRLEDSKTGRRVVPLGTAALSVLAPLARGEPDALVIESAKPGARIVLHKPWKVIRNAAGLDQTVTIHTLRHTFGSWAVMGGLSLPETGAMLGHRSAQTTLRYAHHSQDAMRRNANRVSGTIAAMGKGQPTAEIVPLQRLG